MLNATVLERCEGGIEYPVEVGHKSVRFPEVHWKWAFDDACETLAFQANKSYVVKFKTCEGGPMFTGEELIALLHALEQIGMQKVGHWPEHHVADLDSSS